MFSKIKTKQNVRHTQIQSGNSSTIFKQLGANCTPDSSPWFAEDQPSWVTLSSDPNYGKCLGFVNVPGGVLCSASHPAVRRVCRCSDPATQSAVAAFGTVLFFVIVSFLGI